MFILREDDQMIDGYSFLKGMNDARSTTYIFRPDDEGGCATHSPDKKT